VGERPEPEVVRQDEARRGEQVQQAVEAFVERHTAGKAPDPMTFAEEFPQELRPDILSQCREFLMWDGMLGHQEWQDDEPDEPGGRLFGDFVIQEELGRGGMGVVYLAHQRSLDRRVALKVMASGLTLSKRHVERFRREAMATAQLRHPAIVPVHSLIEVDGTFALAMDYVAGRNLADMLDDLRLRNREGEGVHDGSLGIAPEKGYVAECAMLAAQVASALAAAHHNQVVHRDLKPRNLMLDDRRQVRLLDFGLAKSLDATRESLSMSGEITGTAHYMSPEQTLAKRVEVDHRADIWSLGVILYELLTLSRPFDGKNLQQIVYEICFKEPVALQRRNPKVPRDLVTICAKALEKDPQNRYQTAAQFEADLQRFLRWEPVHAKPVGAWTRASKFVRRHRTEASIAAALLLLLTTVLSFVWYRDAVDARQADDLLRTASRRAEAGDYAQAITLTNQALELRNDEVTRERLGRYHAENKRVENAAAWLVAESRQLLGHDREGAMRLALDAERQLSSAKTRSAVLDALGSGVAARSLRMPSGIGTVAAVFSPSGERIATAGNRGTLQFYRDAGADPRPLHGHGPRLPLAGVTFVDERTLVSAGVDGTLRIWNPEGGGDPITVPLDLPFGRMRPATMTTDAGRSRVLLALYGLANEVEPGEQRPRQIYGTRAFDARTGAPLSDFLDHGSYTICALRHDGALAASCTVGSTLRIWNVTDDTVQVRRKLPLTGRASAIAFSPDGRVVAVGALSGQLLFLDATDGSLLGSARHADAVRSLAFSPDGERLLSGSRDFTARLWRYGDRDGAFSVREVGTLGGTSDEVHHVAFSDDGTLAATASGAANGVIRVFHTAGIGGRQPIHEYRVRESVLRVAFAPDGRRLLATTSRRALVWNFSAARGAISMHQPGKVPALAFVADDRRLLTAGDDERLRRWNVRDGKLDWQTERLGNPVTALAVDGQDRRLACALAGGEVLVHAIDDGAQLLRLPASGIEVLAVQFVADDRLLLAGKTGHGGAIALWDLTARELVRRIDVDHEVYAIAISTDRQLLATASPDEHHPRVWQLPTLAEREVPWPPAPSAPGEDGGEAVPSRDLVRSICFTADGTGLLAGGQRGVAQLYDLDGGVALELSANGPIAHVACSPDGRFVLTCSTGRDGSAQLWRTTDGTEELHFNGHRASLMHATFDSTGALAATSAADGSVWIWPTDPVAVARRLPLHTPDARTADGSHTTRPR
jgi:serine/threonine protein kinase/WD40 repeat protein